MGYTWVAGVDEVGLGPLAGPVVACALVLPLGARIPGLDDSKKIAARRRELVAQKIQDRALAIGVGRAEAAEVDALGITRARQLASARAVAGLSPRPQYLLLDAFDLPDFPLPQLALVHGDRLCASIMAASVVAKVTRDQLMSDYDRRYPGWGFAEHKGYGTALHLSRIAALGPSPIHRLSWRPLQGYSG